MKHTSHSTPPRLLAGRAGFGNLFLAVLVAVCIVAPAAALAQGAKDSAVIFAYQRFSGVGSQQINTTPAQLQSQIAELTNGKYNVRPVSEIIDSLFSGQTLKNRTVGLTIDDAYRTVYENAWPRLKAAGIPFTLFVTTDAVDRGSSLYMTWDQIREMRDNGVTIGTHSASHPHMPISSEAINREALEKSIARIEAELGERPTLFSYPYGEMSLAARNLVAELGFKAAFGRHSGAIYPGADRFLLPRFPMNESYGGPKQFNLRANTLALPLTNVEPADPFVIGSTTPVIGFTIDEAAGRIRAINCFHSAYGAVELHEAGDRRFEIRIDKPMTPGIWRINCTMPTGGKRFRWFGMAFYAGNS